MWGVDHKNEGTREKLGNFLGPKLRLDFFCFFPWRKALLLELEVSLGLGGRVAVGAKQPVHSVESSAHGIGKVGPGVGGGLLDLVPDSTADSTDSSALEGHGSGLRRLDEILADLGVLLSTVDLDVMMQVGDGTDGLLGLLPGVGSVSSSVGGDVTDESGGFDALLGEGGLVAVAEGGCALLGAERGLTNRAKFDGGHCTECSV